MTSNTLASFIIPSRPVVTSGGSFVVHGLSANDITAIANQHGKVISALLKDVKKSDLNDIVAAVESGIIDSIVMIAPALVADIIASGCGERDQPASVAAAGTLPFGVQVQALMDICDLTFEGAGGVGNVVGIVKRAVGWKDEVLPAIN